MNDPLENALARLHTALADFEREAQVKYPEPALRLKRLAAAVETIGREGPVERRDIPEEYRRQWRDFLDKKRPEIEPRAARFLCWDPDISTDARFHEYLARKGVSLTARALQGLVASLHQRWSKELIEGTVGTSTRKLLRNFSGANLRVARWREHCALVVGGKGPALLSEELLKKAAAIRDAANEWGFVEDSAYMREAIATAAAACRERTASDASFVEFLTNKLLPWSGWEQQALKQEFARCILSPLAQEDRLQEGLKRFGRDHFGDPRLPANAGRWTGIPQAARDEFLRWLSRQDIEFFFQLVLPRGEDPHGRKDFWLRYVDRVRRSRPLLANADVKRLRRLHSADLEKVNYGQIEGLSSAFLLDFGELLVVEFSVINNACYLYDRSGADRSGIDRKFWQAASFSPSGSSSGLKQALVAVEHIQHQRPIWRGKMSRLLAQYGIRPGGPKHANKR